MVLVANCTSTGTPIKKAIAADCFKSTMLTPEPLDGDVADKQIALAFHARVTESAHLSTQSQDLLLDRVAGLLPRGMRSATALSQAGKDLLLVSSPPLVEGEYPIRKNRAVVLIPRSRTDSTICRGPSSRDFAFSS